MIVNNTNRRLYLSTGGTSKAILKVAGLELQAECSRRTDGIEFGQIAITLGYGLKCKLVFHAAIPPWGTPAIDAQQVN